MNHAIPVVRHGFASSSAGIFLVLCAAFIPFPTLNFTYQLKITDLLFNRITAGLYHFFSGRELTNPGIHSDAVSMYLLVLLLLLFAIVITSLPFIQKKSSVINSFCYRICCIYLFFVLMKYGLDKIFKAQFYLPEPNILYTAAGNFEKDILFWSVMGSSRVFNLATGAVEILAATLLFFNRTRHPGILISMAALAHVLLINISFDISVKLFSIILLSMAFYLWMPYYRSFIRAVFNIPRFKASLSPTNRFAGFKLLKYTAGITATAILLWPYASEGIFNDDKASRPYLHGAYEVTAAFFGGDSLTAQERPVKKVFIHRNGYLIFQDINEQMRDYHLQYDTINKLLLLQDYGGLQTVLHYRHNSNDSTLDLGFVQNGKKIILKTREINWRQMPLLKDQFNWTSDF